MCPAFETFRWLFAERGLPHAIRSDNGVPFAPPNRLYNLSRLSAWWLRLGIAIERIRPSATERPARAHTPDTEEGSNATAGHELPATAGPVRASVGEFNAGWPHEAFDMKTPAETSGQRPTVPLQSPIVACRRSTVRCTTATSW